MTDQDLTKLKALLAVHAVKAMAPAWIRMPADGEQCPHFGLTAPTYYNLIRAGKIRSILLIKQKGNVKGVRVINYQSVETYLANCQEDRLDKAKATIIEA